MLWFITGCGFLAAALTGDGTYLIIGVGAMIGAAVWAAE